MKLMAYHPIELLSASTFSVFYFTLEGHRTLKVRCRSNAVLGPDKQESGRI
jgi:hypothetical protein